MSCSADGLEWVEAAGTGVVYSKTRVHIQVLPDLVPPYVVALVDLDEGPRLMGNLLDEDCAIGDAVRVAWRERPGLPPCPAFVSAR